MFGAYIRAGITIAAAVLVSAILKFIVPFLLPYQGPEDGILYQSFDALAENSLFIMLIAVAAGVLAAAVAESKTGVR
ncbi:MAG: hypothetical protein ACLFR6_06625 [Salinarchaeum sp.]